MKNFRMVFTVLTLGLLSVGALAQATSGRLVGTVSGPDGVLPGASVVVTDNQTGKELTQTANDSGAFAFPQLEVGTYTVTVKAPNFKTYVATSLKIDVGREYSLNPTLEVGVIAETVTVIAGADIINATSAQITTTVSPKQIRELPLIARNPLNLINLQAGATPSAGFQLTTINGMRTTMTNITRDGINIQDAFIRTNATDFAPGRPSVDDTGEFTISTGNSDSDTGYGGAQVRLVTPRGESKFHGALFEYNRNSAVAANTFFNNRAGSFGPNDATVIQGRAKAGDPRIPRPFRNRNQFGGTISGPAILPRFGEGGASTVKNKSFFFFSYEELRDPVSTLSTRTILTPSARTGQFQFNRATAGAATSFCPGTAVGSLCTVPNILSFARSLGGTFLTVPATIDSVVQSRILNDLPAIGNRTDIGDQLNTTGFAVNRQSSQFRKQYSTRFDYDVNQTNQITGIWSWNKETNLRPDADNNPITTGYTVIPFSDQSSENKQLTLAYRTSFTSNLINEVRGGFFTSDVPFNRLAPLPAFFITPTLINSPETQFMNQGRKTAGYNLQDNADFISGNHAFKFGGVFQFFQVDSYNDALVVPTYTIGVGAATPQFVTANFASLGGISTSQLGTANGLLALLGGIVNGGSQGFNTENRTSGFKPTRLFQPFRYENHALYVQDRWRVKPSLSLTLGLRYELFPALRLANGLALEPTIPEGTDPLTAILDRNGTYSFVGTNAGRENAYYKTDKNNFAPSVGFAWSPSFKNKFLGSLVGEGRTTIRGGYSAVYGNDSIVTSINNAAVGNVGLGRTGGNALNSAGTSTSINDRLQGGITPITPPVFITPPRTYLFNNSPSVGGNFGTVFAVDPNIQIPRVDQFSLGIQREIGFQTAVEVRYVGTRSNNLARSIDYNQVNIFNNGFLTDFERARANVALTGNAFCVSAGCQALAIFQSGAGSAGHLGVGTGGLSAATFNNNLSNGTPADLAIAYISNGLNNHPTVANPTASPFINLIANPATGVANLFQNGGFYNYHSLQAEVRRRFSKGLYFQANYTFSKNLTNAIGTSQTLVEPFLDNNNKALDKSRADYDVTHVFNVNSIYELPFGRGKSFFSGANGIVDRIIGGWQVSAIAAWTSGSPLTFVDTRGTLNRTARSARQTVNTNLTNAQIKDLIGFFETPAGIYFINPAVIDPSTGRGANGFGTSFSGQVFFNPGPGTTGNMARAVVDGPGYFNLDASLIKNIRIKEGMRFQIRGEAFNALNNVNFFPAGQILDISSASFGRLTQTTGARVIQFAGRFEF
jgi:hypothetical protein